MSSIFHRLRGREPTRMDQNDWAAEWMTFGGDAYPIGGGWNQVNSNQESIGNDFSGYVQGAYKASGIVFAVITARMLAFSQVRFQYQKMNKGRPGDLWGNPDLSIFEKPWPNGFTSDLLRHAIQDADLGGNHYVVTEGVGPKKRLRRLRPDWVDIILTSPPDKAVKSDVLGYFYKPGGTQDSELWEFYPIDGSRGVVAHWAPIPDPDAQYRGMSWLTPVLTAIMSDKAMMKHKQKFFENAATPSIAVSLASDVSNKDFRKFMADINRGHNGVHNAYKTLYLGGGADVKVIGSTLQQMDFTATQGHGETLIAAAGRIHPTLVGVSENIHGSELTQANFTAAKNQFADNTLRPLWAQIAQCYSVLVPELTGSRLWYDDRDIPFLRADRLEVAQLENEQATTINSLITAGFTPDSAVKATIEHDLRLLEHTGMFSIQLQPPGGTPPGSGGGFGQGAPAADPAAPTTTPKGDANTPDDADKNPPPADPTDTPD